MPSIGLELLVDLGEDSPLTRRPSSMKCWVDRVDPVATLFVRTRDPDRSSGTSATASFACALFRRPGQDLELRDRPRALPDRRTEAVRTGVAAAEDDDVLALGGDPVRCVVLAWVTVGQRQVLHRGVDAREFRPGREVARRP